MQKKKGIMTTRVKRTVSLFLALLMTLSVFSFCVNAAGLKKLDLAFVVDTTGSMGGDIYQVKEDMKLYLSDLKDAGLDFRVAIVDYRDFASRTGSSRDYPYCVQLNFTSDEESIIYAIDNLTLGNGGDSRETIYSALIDGLNELSWREESGKAAILMGDAPALDPEPYTGYTAQNAVDTLNNGLIASDSVVYSRSAVRGGDVALEEKKRSQITLFAIATSSNSATYECFDTLSKGTGGKTYVADDSSEITEIITEIIDEIPEVVKDNEVSFWDVIKRILKVMWYVITFQWGKI